MVKICIYDHEDSKDDRVERIDADRLIDLIDSKFHQCTIGMFFDKDLYVCVSSHKAHIHNHGSMDITIKNPECSMVTSNMLGIVRSALVIKNKRSKVTLHMEDIRDVNMECLPFATDETKNDLSSKFSEQDLNTSVKPPRSARNMLAPKPEIPEDRISEVIKHKEEEPAEDVDLDCSDAMKQVMSDGNARLLSELYSQIAKISTASKTSIYKTLKEGLASGEIESLLQKPGKTYSSRGNPHVYRLAAIKTEEDVPDVSVEDKEDEKYEPPCFYA